MKIIPEVKHIYITEGEYKVKDRLSVYYPEAISSVAIVLDRHFRWLHSEASDTADLVFISAKGLHQEGYQLEIDANGIRITFSDYGGAIHALMTFRQIFANNRVPQLTITDYPDLKTRGFLLDISRDRIPTMDTLKEVIDIMTLVKMNHLELYVEGFPLYLESFPDLPYETPITPEEYRELDSYCRDGAIDFVPNINSLGHMTNWLRLSKYHHLAECEDGFSMHGYPFPPSTLNPLDKGGFALVRQMISDLALRSESPFFNINGDEPFELSQGKSKAEVANKGLGSVYMDYMRQVIDHVKSLGKTPIMWGDVLINHVDQFADFPKATIVTDWGYDYFHDFEKAAVLYEQSSIPFLLAPGTSSWNSFASRKLDMVASTDNAVAAAIKHGGMGILMTDWGDFGHPQPICFSYPGLVYAAAESWQPTRDFEAMLPWIDDFVFVNSKINPAVIIAALAGYSLLEDQHVSNQTMTFASWMYVDPDPDHSLNLKFGLWKQALNRRPINLEAAGKIKMLLEKSREAVGTDVSLVARELLLTIDLIELSLTLNLMVNHGEDLLEKVKRLSDRLLKDYPALWLEQSRSGGLENSMSRLKVLSAFVNNWKKL